MAENLQELKILDGAFSTNDVKSLDDVPTMTAADLKAVFDYGAEHIVTPAFNALIAFLASGKAAGALGITGIDGVSGTSIQGLLNGLKDLIDERYTKDESDRLLDLKLNQSTANTMVRDVKIDLETGVIRVEKLDGSFEETDTAMEKIAVNVAFDSENQRLVLTLPDGQKEYVDISAFLKPNEFLDSDTIAWSVSGQNITAAIRPESLTTDMLAPALLADFVDKMQKAAASAAAAKTSEENAKAYAENAKADAESAAYSAGKAGNAESSANLSAAAALKHATAAESSKNAAADSESAAAASETAAGEKAEKAAEYAQQAGEYADEANTAKTAAKSSATQAGTYADNAKASEENAGNQATAAAVSAKGAAASQTAAKASETEAAKQAAAAAESAKAAGSSETAAGKSEAAAAESARQAAESAQKTAEIVGGDFATRTELNAHAKDTVQHITAAERSSWNGKGEKGELLQAVKGSGNSFTVSFNFTAHPNVSVCLVPDQDADSSDATINGSYPILDAKSRQACGTVLKAGKPVYGYLDPEEPAFLVTGSLGTMENSIGQAFDELEQKAPKSHTHQQTDINGLADTLGGYLPLSGGTMTGRIVLPSGIALATAESDNARPIFVIGSDDKTGLLWYADKTGNAQINLHKNYIQLLCETTDGSSVLNVTEKGVLVDDVKDESRGTSAVNINYLNGKLKSKADLVSGKVPESQLPEIKAFQVGDIIQTVRKDLDDTWALCNGDEVDESKYPKLCEYLDFVSVNNGFTETVNGLSANAGFCQPCYGNGKYVMIGYSYADGYAWDFYESEDGVNYKKVRRGTESTIQNQVVHLGNLVYFNENFWFINYYDNYTYIYRFDSPENSMTLVSSEKTFGGANGFFGYNKCAFVPCDCYNGWLYMLVSENAYKGFEKVTIASTLVSETTYMTFVGGVQIGQYVYFAIYNTSSGSYLFTVSRFDIEDVKNPKKVLTGSNGKQPKAFFTDGNYIFLSFEGGDIFYTTVEDGENWTKTAISHVAINYVDGFYLASDKYFTRNLLSDTWTYFEKMNTSTNPKVITSDGKYIIFDQSYIKRGYRLPMIASASTGEQLERHYIKVKE